MSGREWVVDAYGCAPDSLKDQARLERLFTTLVNCLALHPLKPADWFQFPGPGGWTGLLMLEESHLACHTFPEHGSLCLSLFCCKPRPEFNFVIYLSREFQAESVRVRRIERPLFLPPAAA